MRPSSGSISVFQSTAPPCSIVSLYVSGDIFSPLFSISSIRLVLLSRMLSCKRPASLSFFHQSCTFLASDTKPDNCLYSVNRLSAISLAFCALRVSCLSFSSISPSILLFIVSTLPAPPSISK